MSECTYQLFDALSADEFAALKASIAQDGILVPIEMDENGNILDGHHRLRAWNELRGEGVRVGDYPRIIRAGMSEEEKRNHVRKLNLLRRHLGKAQLEEQMRQMRADGAGYQAIADAAGVSIGQAHEVARGIQLFKNEKLPGKDGKQYPPSYQKREHPISIFANSAHDERRARDAVPHITDNADNVLSTTGAVQAAARSTTHDPVITPPLPTGRYRCIVIDPPWPVVKIERDERPAQGIVLDYPTMSVDEISALPVSEVAETDGCHIYLWTTHKFLPDALAMFPRWGAHYQCLMTWVKPTGMTPYSWMYNTEHVLFGRIGSLKLERMGLKLSFDAPVTRHSQKPDLFYERVSLASPGPRLEMFARQPRAGFDVWGNEVA